MENSVLLKWLLLIGGYVEIFLGALFVLMQFFVGYMGLSIEVPIFNQILGMMTICFGILLIYSTKDIEKYAIIPKVNCLLRFLVQPAVVYNVIVVPEMIPILIGSAIYDVVWAVLVLILLNKCGYFKI
ncbi:MAG TPA: hypothetical protein VMV49_05295 [Candidatus Deferrimicrobium sp.]|nr:hypothetical protein [Candidatus Deferrimicrobium sp.]